MNRAYSKVGQVTGWAVFILGLIYAFITTVGLLSLKSPHDPVGNPYFTVMELLILLIAPLMAINMVCVHDYAAPADKLFSLIALFFMFLLTGLTSSVHFMVLSARNQIQLGQLPGSFVSFNWPSVVYALDILAWDWFFALAMLFAAPVFKKKSVRTLMIVCGLLSLGGLLGVPLSNMQIRNIGLVGYGLLGPIVFLLIGKTVGQPKDAPSKR